MPISLQNDDDPCNRTKNRATRCQQSTSLSQRGRGVNNDEGPRGAYRSECGYYLLQQECRRYGQSGSRFVDSAVEGPSFNDPPPGPFTALTTGRSATPERHEALDLSALLLHRAECHSRSFDRSVSKTLLPLPCARRSVMGFLVAATSSRFAGMKRHVDVVALYINLPNHAFRANVDVTLFSLEAYFKLITVLVQRSIVLPHTKSTRKAARKKGRVIMCIIWGNGRCEYFNSAR